MTCLIMPPERKYDWALKMFIKLKAEEKNISLETT